MIFNRLKLWADGVDWLMERWDDFWDWLTIDPEAVRRRAAWERKHLERGRRRWD